jgi:outer membrane protein assembly factor BamB
MASPAICGGHIYLLERRSGILTCVDAVTGTVAYRQRVPGARAFWASPWVCGDRVYCLDADGTTHVIAGGPEFDVLAKNRLDEQTWSSPAVANGTIYLRTIDNLYCIAQAE